MIPRWLFVGVLVIVTLELRQPESAFGACESPNGNIRKGMQTAAQQSVTAVKTLVTKRVPYMGCLINNDSFTIESIIGSPPISLTVS